MNILYYIPELSQDWGGTRQYAAGLLKIMARDNDNNYFVIHNNSDPVILKILAEQKNIFHIPINKGKEKFWQKWVSKSFKLINLYFLLRKSNKRIKVWTYIDRICKNYKIDIIHSPHHYAPDSYIKTIVTLHDVQELHFPEYFTPEERFDRSYVFLESIKSCDHVIVSYTHIKNDIKKYFRYPEDKISVLLLDMQNLWFENYLLKSPEIDLKNYGIHDRYLLYPANTWEHKNHIRLIEAVALLKDKNNIRINVVFTGSKTLHYQNIEKIIDNLGLKDQLIFLGKVNEDLLFTLYKNAAGVVIPTTYEAGSFPLVEAILIGVPVVCSNVTSLPETIGNEQKFIFDPFSIDDIADKLYRLLFDENFKNENLVNSLKCKENLKNNNALDNLKSIYKNFVI